MLTTLANLADGFIGLFKEGGNVFVGLVTGILPTLIVLITAVNALELDLDDILKNQLKNIDTLGKYSLY